MRKYLLSLLTVMSVPTMICSAQTEGQQKAVRNIQRAMDIMDATWNTSVKGTPQNMYMVDTYNTKTGEVSGPSDVWPYTAAIEAHCSLLEALEDVKEIDPEMYAEKHDKYVTRLNQLIDNLEYYRGTLNLPSYANNTTWRPYAVPRANQRGKADVSGILNVYDDQMWLARELVRAYRITSNTEYLTTATELTDYAIDGWDCWRDENGVEYGGITWGPGYNSKHSCSNAPIIQPLVWLSEIYRDSESTIDYFYRDENNAVKKENRKRSDHYLEFAQKVYDWQKTNLKHSSGVYWDMMGADNTIRVSRGYRQHVDCGGATGSLISYNTGTMISGAAELFKATDDPVYSSDMADAAKASMNQFSKYVRKYLTYEFTTDNTAREGFNTWFNDVLMRSYVDAAPYVDNSTPKNALNAFQTNLDYAFENHNRNNLLPIHLLDGWGDETITKGFHQFSFASEYAMLARWIMREEGGSTAITVINANTDNCDDDTVYTISGVRLGSLEQVGNSLPDGIYIVGHKKMRLGK